MSKKDNDILVDEMGELGGLVGGLGAKWAARLLPNNTYEISCQLAAEPASVLAAVTNILNTEGKPLGSQEISGAFEARAVIGSGFLNMNPAVVTLIVRLFSGHFPKLPYYYIL